MRRWLLSATCWMCEYPAKAGASHCKMPQNRWFFGRWGKTQSRAASLTCPCLRRLRSGYSTKDYSLTGLVWSAVNLSPEQLGHGVSLKVTVVCDSLREPLTFTCDCKCPTPRSRLQQLGGGNPSNPQVKARGGGGVPPSLGLTVLSLLFAGSSTVDLLIYQALCYTHDELHTIDVEDFVLKICGLEEFLQK